LSNHVILFIFHLPLTTLALLVELHLWKSQDLLAFQPIINGNAYLKTSKEVYLIGELGIVKFTMSVPKPMKEALEEEQKRRRLDTIQETIRSILSEYFLKG